MRNLLIGVGNDFRRDDAVGLVVARLALDRARGRIHVHESNGEAGELLEAWKGAGTVILVDAVRSGGHAGTIHRIDTGDERLQPGLTRCSTHAFGLAEAVELSRMLKRLPQRLIVYGIEGKDFGHGVGLSPEADEASVRVAESVLDELDRLKSI